MRRECIMLLNVRNRSYFRERKCCVLELKHIHKDYPAGEGKVNAVGHLFQNQHLSLTVNSLCSTCGCHESCSSSTYDYYVS